MLDPRQPGAIAARTLTIVGGILIISSLLDYTLMMFPANFLDRTWQMAVTSQLVDRGILPMVGLAFLFAGYGINAAAGGGGVPQKALLDVKFWGLLLSSLLGLLFLLLFPLHLNNVRLDRMAKINEIGQRSQLAEAQIKTQVSNPEISKQIEQQRGLVKNQLSELVKDPQKLDEALKSGRVPQPQAELLRKFKENPQEIDQFLEKEFNAPNLADRELQRIRGSRQQLEEQTNQVAFKSGLQTGISSLLLSLGYAIIGWTGLKNLGYIKAGRRKNQR